MTATREHMAGLELALKTMTEIRTASGGVHIGALNKLSELVAEAQSAEPVQGEAFKINAKPEVAENTGSTTTNSTPTGSGAGSLPVEAAATACEAGEGVDIFAWATFDGEGGYDLRLFENNERYMTDWLETNGARYARWVFPLYTSPAKPDAELVGLLRDAAVAMSAAHESLFDQCLSNGIKNAWGKPVDVSKVNALQIFANRIDAKLAELQK